MTDFLIFIGGILLATVLLVFSIAFAANHMGVGPQLAAIEQLRADAAVVDPAQAEDVIGQVTEANQMIVGNQYWNQVAIIGWTVPDEWDDVQIIEVPR